MALSQSLRSSRFPYLPVQVDVGQDAVDVEALLDTGFDGDVALPPDLLPSGEPPAGYMMCRLADGSLVAVPVFRGTVKVGSFGVFQAYITALGDEPLVGRGVSDRFRITLDHGRQVIVEP
jgi:predicted aspartyl protease